ncbi:UPF0496 protein 1-like [Cynara cardunculus var. scolymus]|uniref:UPF0496 protein 1-like n=1 Tax=Cynara cardunculus var. scolymus TaxID=59895 RepID=UPI000D62B9AF|nr:UPF0496 protein 1-like [Cynara cardunculus var. scolymus]
MGCLFSKHSGHPRWWSSCSSKFKLNPDLTSYQDACRSDPDLKSFDSTQRDRTTRVIKSVAADVQVRSLSLDSLRQVIGSLHDMNQDVVKFLLECEEDISKSHELSSLVKDFFRLSILILDFCISLENCLKNASYSSSFLQIAIKQFDEDNDHLKTLEHFKQFKALEAPFPVEFFRKYESVCEQQQSMQKKLEKQTGKVAKKLKSAKVWRKLTNVIFVVTFSAVLICTVVTAAVSAPAVVIALAAAAAAAVGPMGKWVDSLWKEYETELKGQRKVMISMDTGNDVVIAELKNIKALVDKFGNEREDLLQKAEFAIKEEEKDAEAVAVADAVAAAVNEMRRIMSDFEKTIADLSRHSLKIRGDIVRARDMIVKEVTQGLHSGDRRE